jgi:hypothetical protein
MPALTCASIAYTQPYSLFSDYLPELARAHGAWFRWPHCPQPWAGAGAGGSSGDPLT